MQAVDNVYMVCAGPSNFVTLGAIKGGTVQYCAAGTQSVAPLGRRMVVHEEARRSRHTLAIRWGPAQGMSAPTTRLQVHWPV